MHDLEHSGYLGFNTYNAKNEQIAKILITQLIVKRLSIKTRKLTTVIKLIYLIPLMYVDLYHHIC